MTGHIWKMIRRSRPCGRQNYRCWECFEEIVKSRVAKIDALLKHIHLMPKLPKKKQPKISLVEGTAVRDLIS